MRKTYQQSDALFSSFEQSKKLKSLGIEQSSFHYWYAYDGHSNKEVRLSRNCVFLPSNELEQGEFAAFTCAELGVMIPRDANGIHSYYTIGDQMVSTGEFGFIVMSYDGQIVFPDKLFETEAAARAELIIYLLENNIATAEQINNQLEQ